MSEQGSGSSAAEAPSPFRRAVGGDFFVTTFPADSDCLWLDAGFPVEGWNARPVQRPHQPAFPGTPIHIDHHFQRRPEHDDWWEIEAMRVQPDAAGVERFVYQLRPWQGHILRGGVELTPESARRFTEEHRVAARHTALSDRAALFMPFYGLMPAADQQEIESRYGLPPGRATVLTASLLLLLSVYGVMLALAAVAGHGGADTGLAHDFRFLLAYLVVESLLRMSVGAGGDPMGSALVAVPMAVVRVLKQERHRRGGGALPAAPGRIVGDEAGWLEATDVVKKLPPTEDGRALLEVVSPLAKEHWRAQVDLIYYRDTAYVLEEREQVPSGHRFLLEQPPEGMRRTRAVHQYDPTEVREIYKEERRIRTEAWIETLAPLVGFTEPALQQELAEIYKYRPYRAVFHSIVFALIFGVIVVRTGWVFLSGPHPTDPLLLLCLGVMMVWENSVRGVRLARGELTSSVLGRLVSPLARRALRWRHDPSWPYPPTGRT